MKEVLLCVFLSQSLSVMGCPLSGSQKKQHGWQQTAARNERKGHEWRPATYRGLVVGKSTRADMLRVFGKPQSSGPPGDQTEGTPSPEMWNEYEGGGEFPGKLTVIIDEHSSVIIGIDLYPENLSKAEAIKHFGTNYLITRYDFDSCLSNDSGESSPLYESPNGSLVNVEYRVRGIAIAINYQDKVNHISYVKGAIGASSSKCKQAGKTI